MKASNPACFMQQVCYFTFKTISRQNLDFSEVFCTFVKYRRCRSHLRRSYKHQVDVINVIKNYKHSGEYRICTGHFLWLNWAPKLSRDVAANAGSLCEKAAVLWWAMKYTSCYDSESNEQVATISVNLLFLVSSTCFGRLFRPSSGALDCIYSIW
jgi:hypothetical protein